MCKEATNCELSERVGELGDEIELLKSRVTSIEDSMNSMRTEMRDGFSCHKDDIRQINVAVSRLAHDFGQRMNIIEKKVVDEKAEWGKTLRKVVLWSAATLLSGCAVAMGVTIWKNFMVQ